MARNAESLSEFFDKLGLLAGPNIQLDGKFHRIPTVGKPDSDNGWYVGRELPVKFVAAGDWSNPLAKETWSANGKKLDKEQKNFVGRMLAEERLRADREKVEGQRRAAKTASDLLASATKATHPYLQSKSLHAITADVIDGTLIVPMRDQHGAIWGVQRIAADGQKKFLVGQATKGLAFCFPGSEQIFLCEGYATGASISLATGGTVYCAFSAANLPDVASWVRAQNPTAAITICGDDDQWSPGNVGRAKAQEAAELVTAALVFPSFADETSRPTDFNDLHALEGLDILREQLGRAKGAAKGIVPLGRLGSQALFYDAIHQDLVKFTTYTQCEFFELAPLEYWAKRYPNVKNRDGEAVNWSQARSDMVQIAKKAGSFDPRRVRGPGVWVERSKNTCLLNTVVNTGHALYVGGQLTSAARHTSKYVYVRGDILPDPTGPAATIDECRPLLRACELMSWQDPVMGHYLAGWLAVAAIGATLPHRPHIYLTAPAGAGKSTILNHLVKPLLIDYAPFQGATTAAGIRQSMLGSTKPVIFDEFETGDDDQNRRRLDDVLELFRQAWSETDGSVVKGSANGQANAYYVAFPALVASIRLPIKQTADFGRFTILELLPHAGDSRRWQEITRCLDQLGHDLAVRLWRRMTQMVPVVLKNIESLRKQLTARGYTQRWSDQHAPLLAGVWALLHDGEIESDGIDDFLGRTDKTNDPADEPADDDAGQLLTHILTSEIRSTPSGVPQTVGSLVASASGDDWKCLARHGILRKDDGIYLSFKHETLRALVRRTRWADNPQVILKRYPGARMTTKTISFPDHKGWPVILPTSVLDDLRGFKD